MKLFINRQLYIAALIGLILFGVIKTDSVRGTELLTESVGGEIEFEPAPNFLDGALSRITASGIGRSFFNLNPVTTGSLRDNFEGLLYSAIMNRMGIPYRSGGIDDNGYDCSGFVWRVFREAGIHFKRNTARAYWESLPKATGREETQFGTLVFFDNLTHVGVVRDPYSFYHASSSQGVTRSSFSEYWGQHIRGFRRIPLF
jgi:hypothetical protein